MLRSLRDFSIECGVLCLLVLADLNVRERHKDFVGYGGLPSKLALAHMRRAGLLARLPSITDEDRLEIKADLDYALSFVDSDIANDGREDYWYAASKLYTEATKIVSSIAGENAELQQLAWHYYSLAQRASHKARDYKRSAQIRSLPFVRKAA